MLHIKIKMVINQLRKIIQWVKCQHRKFLILIESLICSRDKFITFLHIRNFIRHVLGIHYGAKLLSILIQFGTGW